MIKIRKYRPQDAKAAARLISRTYSKFNWTEGMEEAVRRYIRNCDPNQNLADIRIRFKCTPIFFVALDGTRVVGIVRGIGNRIANLFVEGAYHRQGIGTRLEHKFKAFCSRSGFQEIVLRSSLYAIPFYQALGYKKTTGIRSFHGLKIQPMKKIL